MFKTQQLIPYKRLQKVHKHSLIQNELVSTFKGLMEPVFNQALKAGHFGFATDTYIKCISSSL